jgi:hypothetical protein
LFLKLFSSLIVFNCFLQTSVEEEFNLYYKLCEILFEKKRFSELQQVTFSLLSSSLFAKFPELVKVSTATTTTTTTTQERRLWKYFRKINHINIILWFRCKWYWLIHSIRKSHSIKVCFFKFVRNFNYLIWKRSYRKYFFFALLLYLVLVEEPLKCEIFKRVVLAIFVEANKVDLLLKLSYFSLMFDNLKIFSIHSWVLTSLHSMLFWLNAFKS